MSVLQTHDASGRELCSRYGCANLATRKAVVRMKTGYLGAAVADHEQAVCDIHEPIHYTAQVDEWVKVI